MKDGRNILRKGVWFIGNCVDKVFIRIVGLDFIVGRRYVIVNEMLCDWFFDSKFMEKIFFIYFIDKESKIKESKWFVEGYKISLK